MLASEGRVGVWTESLNDKWVFQSGYLRRIERGTFRSRDLPTIIRHIWKKNDVDVECLVVLQGYDRILNIQISGPRILVSDPQNLNYQNVAVEVEDLPALVDHYFSPVESVSVFEWTKSATSQWIALVLVLCGLAGSVFYMARYLIADSSFFPSSIILEIEDPAEIASLIKQHSGFYLTGIADGEMALELSPGGAFRYYDIRRGAPGHYLLETVDTGSFRPVYEAGKQALITDFGYVFYPREEKSLFFQSRPYNRIGSTWEDIPYFALQEEE